MELGWPGCLSLVAFGVFIGLGLCWLYSFCCGSKTQDLERENRILKEESKEKGNYAQVFFYPDPKLLCNSFFYRLKNGRGVCRLPGCSYFHYDQVGKDKSTLANVLLVLTSANSSIDICVFLFTIERVASLLIHLKRNKGIQIRFITDSGSKNEKENNQASVLQQAGIPVKTDLRREGALMHNKFVVIDKKRVIHGSFNWTTNAILSNHETCVIDSNPKIIRSFSKQFEYMWSTLSNLAEVDRQK